MQQYRLEIDMKRLYGLHPILATAASKISVEVRFLDFPPIVIHPQGYSSGDVITYNMCHKATFLMSAEQINAALPATCNCRLLTDSTAEMSQVASIHWTCPCTLVPSSSSAGGTLAAAPRSCVSYPLRNAAQELVGSAEMVCTVSPPVPPEPPVAPAAVPAEPSVPTSVVAPAPPPAPATATVTAAAPVPTPLEPSQLVKAGNTAKPYIVRVVVGDQARRGGRAEGEAAQQQRRSVVQVQGPSHGGARDEEASPVNTAEENTLLYLLQYDVAYQLQSLSETVAATIQREYDVLNGAKLDAHAPGHLLNRIGQSVANIVKLSNIALQIANQLVEGTPAPSRPGTNRAISDHAKQRRNPVNKLPSTSEGTVGHYLTYDVLYQLQCLGVNISYTTLAYRTALQVPLTSLPEQHVKFCKSIGSQVQELTKQVNILIQSTLDGRIVSSGGQISKTRSADRPKHKGRSSRKAHRSASPQHPASPSTSLSSSTLSSPIISQKRRGSIRGSSISSSPYSSSFSSSSSLSSTVHGTSGPPIVARIPVLPIPVTTSSGLPTATPSTAALPVPISTATHSLDNPQPHLVNRREPAQLSPSLATLAQSTSTIAAPGSNATIPTARPWEIQTHQHQTYNTASESSSSPMSAASAEYGAGGAMNFAAAPLATTPWTFPPAANPVASPAPVVPPPLAIPSPLSPPTVIVPPPVAMATQSWTVPSSLPVPAASTMPLPVPVPLPVPPPR